MFIINYVVPNKINRHRTFLITNSLFTAIGVDDDCDIDNDYFLNLVIDLEGVPIDESNKIITIQHHVGLCKTEWLVFTPY
jgi:hypothetical protein